MPRWQIVYIVGKLKFDVTNKIREMFTTFSQQILSDGLLLVVMDNLSCRFKLEPITTYHLWFIVKILWM